MSHLSFSQIETYLDCQRRHAFRRDKRFVEPPNGYQVLGQSVHTTIEYAMKSLAQQRPLPGPDALVEHFGRVWGMKSGDQRIVWDEELPPEIFKARGQAMLRAAGPELGNFTPLSAEGIEREVMIPLRVPGWDFKGVIDLVTADGWLVDWKTAKRSWGKEEDARQAAAQKRIQAPLYYLLYNHEFGDWPKGFIFFVMIAGDKKLDAPARIEIIKIEKTLQQVLICRDMVEDIARQMETGHNVPNPTSNFCSAKSCHFYTPCQGDGTDE